MLVAQRFKKLSLNDAHHMLNMARKGVQPKLFYDFAETIKCSESSLADLINVSTKTINNYHSSKKVLNPVISEHLLKIIALYEKGEKIFGSIEEFNYWLHKPFWNEEERPADWLITPGGVDLLMDELDKLAEGYPV